jgi:phosphoenolpyruvate carboxykinase (GTP)
LKPLSDWVAELVELAQPADIHWCDGSDAEYHALLKQMLADGTLSELNQSSYPGCFLHRSDPQDVARVEHLTYVCTAEESAAGPNNNWMEPSAAHAMMDNCFAGCMRGRTM